MQTIKQTSCSFEKTPCDIYWDMRIQLVTYLVHAYTSSSLMWVLPGYLFQRCRSAPDLVHTILQHYQLSWCSSPLVLRQVTLLLCLQVRLQETNHPQHKVRHHSWSRLVLSHALRPSFQPPRLDFLSLLRCRRRLQEFILLCTRVPHGQVLASLAHIAVCVQG